jgi:hypothetical protein
VVSSNMENTGRAQAPIPANQGLDMDPKFWVISPLDSPEVLH